MTSSAENHSGEARGVLLSRVTAIIVNWRTPDLTLQSARSLIADGLAPEQIIVVDNGSGDNSADAISAALPTSLVIPLPMNVGFGAGNNRAAEGVTTDYLLLVNSDAFVATRGSLASLIARGDATGAGIVSPKLINTDGTLQNSVFPPHTTLSAAIRASGLSRFVPDALQPHVGTHWSHNRVRRVAAVKGAVMLVRTPVWRDLGGFDSSFYHYSEELDLCWRARQAGADIWFEPAAKFTHIGGSSGQMRWSRPEIAERIATAERSMVRRRASPAAAAGYLAATRLGHQLRYAWRRFRRDDLGADFHAAALRGYSPPSTTPSADDQEQKAWG